LVTVLSLRHVNLTCAYSHFAQSNQYKGVFKYYIVLYIANASGDR